VRILTEKFRDSQNPGKIEFALRGIAGGVE